MLVTRAPAKINLSLSVLGRRADGYHDLVSLVAFAGVGDLLSLDPQGPRGLSIRGPFAEGLSSGADNLVLRAIAALGEALGARDRLGERGAFILTKRLPVASGIGGGSADAAAALRLCARLNGLALDDPALIEAAIRTGADVPVCLASRARIMSGLGDELGPVLSLPKLFAVLVNPGVAIPTASIFARLGLAKGERLHERVGPDLPRNGSAATLVAALAKGPGNDLEDPALAEAPVIAKVLAAFAASPGCRLARMSGSGATCFGLYDDCRASAEAARTMARAHPGWWIKATVLR